MSIIASSSAWHPRLRCSRWPPTPSASGTSRPTRHSSFGWLVTDSETDDRTPAFGPLQLAVRVSRLLSTSWLGRGVALAAVGLLAWALMWSTIRPRAGYDTLWYAMYAYQYAGVPVQQSWDLSWQVTHEYADPSLLALLRRDPSGAWWSGWG